jgi:hypothetical protein
VDLYKFIKSLEEFLYEVATWLVFYPRTFWIALTRPAALAVYTDVELSENVDEQFTDVVSPPMFFLLTLLLAHALELAAHVQFGEHKSELANKVLESDTNLLIFRSIAFCLFPVFMANGLMRRLRLPVDRNTLRRPFYIQCYFAAPYIILTSVAVLLVQWNAIEVRLLGVLLWAVAIVRYLIVEARWFRERLGVTRVRAFGIALRLYLFAAVLGLGAALLVVAPEVVSIIREG